MFSPGTRLLWTEHAIGRAIERELEPAWIEKVALAPDWIEPDAKSGINRHYGVIAAAGGKVLRVAVVDTGRGWKRILSAHFDRNAARKRIRDAPDL